VGTAHRDAGGGGRGAARWSGDATDGGSATAAPTKPRNHHHHRRRQATSKASLPSPHSFFLSLIQRRQGGSGAAKAMAVDLMSCGSGGGGAYEHLAFQEAAAAGLRSLELLASSLSPRAAGRAESPPLGQIADQAVSRFRRVINLLDRTGHARFRRAPAAPPATPPESPRPAPVPQPPAAAAPTTKSLTLDFTKPPPAVAAKAPAPAPAASATSTSFLSSVTAGGEGSVSKGCSLAAVSSGKPPLPKRKHPASGAAAPAAHHHHAEPGAARCHCLRKPKRSQPARAVSPHGACDRRRGSQSSSHSPALSDIPGDEYSWRKYGQKPINGSPYPRGYYRCSSVKGVPRAEA